MTGSQTTNQTSYKRYQKIFPYNFFFNVLHLNLLGSLRTESLNRDFNTIYVETL